MDYNFSKLWSAQFFGFYKFKYFFEYASEKENQLIYYKKKGATRIDNTGVYHVEASNVLIEKMVAANESALEMIKNHFIVFLFTRYEFIIQETIKCLFCDSPERIIKFLDIYSDYEKYIGFSLKEFISCETKDEYVTMISERLSLKILSGKPSKVINRLKCLLNINSVDVSIIDELMVKRNCIVHEGMIYKFDLVQLEKYYNAIDDLLKVLAVSLKEINIAVIDEGELLI